MNQYLNAAKARFIRSAKNDLLTEFGIDSTPWTNKVFFYFHQFGNRKYVYKPALEFIYNNAETYTSDPLPDGKSVNGRVIPVDVVGFLEKYRGELLPKLVWTSPEFLVYEYVDGEPVNSISNSEYFYLKNLDSEIEYTPFMNSMTYNLVRTADSIKLVDYKHFDRRIGLPFFVYFYNSDHGINRLYTDVNTELDPIIAHLSVDYPANIAEIIRY